MDKLYLWYNPKKDYIYSKICRNCLTPINKKNQYGHILLTTLSYFNGNVYADLSAYKCYKIMAKERDTRYKRLSNRLDEN